MTTERPFQPSPTGAEDKLAEYRRMWAIATSLLAAMAIVFVVASVTRASWPWLPYVRAFAEAGMVGACADWFAVVALFRRPFGLPIPHTAVVPANKQRIGAALGRFIANNFLSPRIANKRLARIDILLMLAHWIAAKGNSEKVAQWTTQVLPEAIAAVPSEALENFAAAAARRGIAAIPAAPLASRVLTVLWARGEAQALIELGLEHIEAALA
ncbi:MAG: DUF445 family protein, partial [Hyphomicrobiales bacterium]|nr:DUF445 family protein [Hyphomicrobiales bacterium]